MCDQGYLQGYNAQAIANQDSFIIMALVSSAANDYQLFQPSIEKMKEISAQTGISIDEVEFLTDAGYWSHENYQYSKEQGLSLLCSTCHEPDVFSIRGVGRALLDVDQFHKDISRYGCNPAIAASIGEWCARNLCEGETYQTPQNIAKEIMNQKMEPHQAKNSIQKERWS